MLTSKLKNDLKKQLLDDRQEVLRKIDRLRSSVIMDYEKGDEDEVDLERATTLGRIQELEQRLLSIDHALQRIAQGQYGLCQNCGGEIAAERLEVMPETTLCLTCKASGEHPAKPGYVISSFE